MARPSRVSGRLLALEVDNVDCSEQVSNATFTSAEGDSDFLDFVAARSGGNRDYTFTGTIAQDTAAASLYMQLWDNVGDEVPITIAPHGNTTASVAQPHWEATAIISEPDGTIIGGEATTSTSGAHTVELVWKLTGRPVKVTA